MACFKQYANLWAAEAAIVAGGFGILGSGVIEAGSVGALTPAAAAVFIGSVVTILGSIAWAVSAYLDLADCLDAAGKTQAAAAARARATALQAEAERLQALADRVRAATGVA